MMMMNSNGFNRVGTGLAPYNVIIISGAIKKPLALPAVQSFLKNIIN
jgi:hypothetical protein